MRGDLALEKLISECKDSNYSDVLDIGAGPQREHAIVMEANGLNVSTNDFLPQSTYVGDYLSLPPFEKPFQAIWSCHTLEHHRNPGLFLERVFDDLQEGGVLAITVPPLKHKIVSGHVTLWNAGLLLFNIVLAGFNCRDASVATYDYNCSVVVRKKSITEVPVSERGVGRLSSLTEFFPPALGDVSKGFDGQITRVNW